MTTHFNPYHKWLGIPQKDLPANDYRLLGIENFESDVDVISNAADQRMTHVRGFQTGRHSELSQEILNEISAARIRLLNPAKKLEYDCWLRQQISQSTGKVPPNVAGSHTVEPLPPPLPRTSGDETNFQFSASLLRPPRKKSNLFVVVSSCAALAILAGGAIAWYSIPNRDRNAISKNTESPKKSELSPDAKQSKIEAEFPKSAERKPAPQNDKRTAVPQKPDTETQKTNKSIPSPDNVNNIPPKSTAPNESPYFPKSPEPKKPENKPAPARNPTPVAHAGTGKQPIPDERGRERGLAWMKKVYGDQIENSGESALAEAFIKKAGDRGNESDHRYALLKLARDVAVRAGELQPAFDAIVEMDRTFEIDAASMKREAAADFLRSADTAFEKACAAEDLFDLVRDAMRNRDADLAQGLLAMSVEAARSSKDKCLIEWLSKNKAEIDCRMAMEIQLENEPNDPEANLELGKYYCFAEGDSRKGFSLLARSGDSDLSKLAEGELKGEADAQEQLALGDGWWKLSQNAKDPLKKPFQNLAVGHYRKALSGLSKPQSVAVEKRLMDIEKNSGYGKKTTAGSGKPFYWRKEPVRTVYLREHGGNGRTEKAVESGLAWLARHQSSDGSWGIDNFICPKKTCDGAGMIHNANAAGTALGVLPFLAAGQTQQSKGPYKPNIAKAVNWLIKNQKADGDLSAGGPQMYSHGLATIALCEAYGMTNDPHIRHAAQAAVQFIEAAQNDAGSWRYVFKTSESDTSVYGWQMMALKSAIMANLAVDPAKVEKARKWLETVQSKDFDLQNRGRFFYQAGGQPTPATTAVGVLVTQHLGKPKDDPAIAGGIGYLLKNAPDVNSQNVYYWYYATQATFNMCDRDWDAWNRKMRSLLLKTQCKTGCAAGSWDPNSPAKDRWGATGGRLMMTSLSLLTLEIYYRYLPLYDR